MRRRLKLASAALAMGALAVTAGPLNGQAADDPFLSSSGSWGQAGDDQWALKHVRIPQAWNNLGGSPQPVVVAVIDTGLDWNHLDLDWSSIWENPGEIAGNGIDDDRNGFVDDMIGWDFFANSNEPWDYDGHGTFISGVIAAKTGNGSGIAGGNPYARIMVVKAVNNFGRTRAFTLAQGITYAVDNGAKIINLSVGGTQFTDIEREALDYAEAHGVLVIAAAGNEAQEIVDYAPASHPTVLTVGSSDANDERANFSNWGRQIDLVAPGTDILSLRARRTDTMLNVSEAYQAGTNFVGSDRRYYWSSGTSFSAPLVTAAASLLLSKNPDLEARELRRLLQYGARDIDAPGVDRYTGYGVLDAAASVEADPRSYIFARVDGVRPAMLDGQQVAVVLGSAGAYRRRSAVIQIGQGENPTAWTRIADVEGEIEEGQLGAIPATAFAGGGIWIVRVVVTDSTGKSLEGRFQVNLS
jgi:subtilisin family serine protease